MSLIAHPMLVLSTLLVIILGVVLISYKKQLQYAASKIDDLNTKNRRLKKKQINLYQNLKSLREHPDLESARSISLDYLRVMMVEDHFRSLVLTQIKGKLARDLLPLIRSDEETPVGIARKSRLVECTLNIRYRSSKYADPVILFRVKLRIYRHPEIKGNSIVKQLFYVISNFLSPERRDLKTKAELFGYASHIQWDSNSKPTPCLTLYQDTKYNVTLRDDKTNW